MSGNRAFAVLGLVPFVLPMEVQGLDRIETEPGRSEEEVEPRFSVVFEGLVLDAAGAPAAGALVVSSAGGKAVADARGSYRLEVPVPADARSVQVTAVGALGERLVASASVPLPVRSSLASVGPLWLTRPSACQPSWLPTFGGEPGVSGNGATPIQALTVFDDGSGPALYVAGLFQSAGAVQASCIAKWDGSSWSALGAGITSFIVYALAVFDDGSGPALYAGGDFLVAGSVPAESIAKWDGSTWSALGSGIPGYVRTLAVFDDGDGPALFVGGGFQTVGGIPARNVARWDGSSWSALGAGLNSQVEALAVFDDGSGPELYAGGFFTPAIGGTLNHLAVWKGETWASVQSGVNDEVHALEVFDDGSGAALYVGGDFTLANGMPANRVVKWNGASLSKLGSGLNGLVEALQGFDDGSGPALYAGGYFANSVAEWKGETWTPLASGMSAVRAMEVFEADGVPALHAAGHDHIRTWNGSSWGNLGKGIDNTILATAVFDDGSGAALYAGGTFDLAGGLTADNIVKWDGSSWATLAGGIPDEPFSPQSVHALTVFDDGGGPALYAGGDIFSAGGVSVGSIAKWDGSSWSDLDGGTTNTVDALAVFDDGSGPALYAGGSFFQAGGVAASRIARWNGSSWSALGSGVNGEVEALAVYDDGSGPALYVAGEFSSAGGVPASRIAKWNGSTWSALGSGLSSFALSLAVLDDGSGPALYVGGFHTSAGGVTVNRIAKWDGSSWSALGSGMNAQVDALGVFDDGHGPALYAGGAFLTAGGVAANRIAKWDGSSWTALGSGANGSVRTLTVFHSRSGPALYAGGSFTSAFDSGDSFLAKWGCPDTTPPAIACPAPIEVGDFDGTPGESVSFTVTAVDPEDFMPSLVCIPPSGSFFPRGTTLVTCTATDFSGNAATCQFPVTVRSHLRQLSPR